MKTTNEEEPRQKRSKEVRVGRTRVGKGIFAQKHYREHDIVGEITGRMISDPNYGSDYCFRVGEDACLEPFPPFRYVNHSCDPNCEFDWFALETDNHVGSTTRVFLIALRHIKPGEELVIDYNWSAESAIPCRCGSPSCRGWIVDPDDLSRIHPLAPSGSLSNAGRQSDEQSANARLSPDSC